MFFCLQVELAFYKALVAIEANYFRELSLSAPMEEPDSILAWSNYLMDCFHGGKYVPYSVGEPSFPRD